MILGLMKSGKLSKNCHLFFSQETTSPEDLHVFSEAENKIARKEAIKIIVKENIDFRLISDVESIVKEKMREVGFGQFSLNK